MSLDTMLHWGEFAAVSAVMEHRGVPTDMEIASQLLDKHAWAFARDAIVPKINAQYGVYVQDAAGEWHFSILMFEAYCGRAGITWPRHEGSGELDLRSQDLRDRCMATRRIRRTRITAPAAAYPKQDATGQTGDRRRRA